eukprot:scaffold644_cov168-Ochromonas_danica.AAC.45
MTDEEFDFDWISYLDMNRDVEGSKGDHELAWQHYHIFGKKEKRIFPRRFPSDQSLSEMEVKLNSFLAQSSSFTSANNRTLVIYHIPPVPDTTSHDALINTLKFFVAAVKKDPFENSSNFYIFNVMLDESSPYVRYLPLDQKNVALLSWNGPYEQNLIQIRTMDLFHVTGLTEHFGFYLFNDIYTRGPFTGNESGKWLQSYRDLFNGPHNIGLVGSSFSCELVPHVQNFSWSIKREVIPLLMSAFNLRRNHKQWKSVVRYNLQYLSVLVKKRYNVTSFLYHNRLQEPYFTGSCLSTNGPPNVRWDSERSMDNPVNWCDLTLTDVPFIPWNYLRSHHICDTVREALISHLFDADRRFPDEQFFVPETVIGGYLHDVSLQYHEEMYIGSVAKQLSTSRSDAERRDSNLLADQVCLLVRSSYVHSQDRNVSLLDQDYFSGFDNLRQTDSNWMAFFFITDEHPFSSKLKKILQQFNDPRLQFLHIPREDRPPYTGLDAGYTASDSALRKLLGVKQCGYISLTNADNIYGSDLVRRVRGMQSKRSISPKMVLVPVDSRNFLYQDLMGRATHGIDSQAVCRALITVLRVNTLGLTVQPRPILGKIDLAGVFFDRNFTDPVRFPCTGCQDGYFTEYLVQDRHWRYAQLPIDGLQSVVFHGPSPVWCAAAGLVWFGHPKVNKARCFTHNVIMKLRKDDIVLHKSTGKHHFDWAYYEGMQRVCLRYTGEGYDAFLRKHK